MKIETVKQLAPEAPADAIVNMDAAQLKETLGIDFSDEPADPTAAAEEVAEAPASASPAVEAKPTEEAAPTTPTDETKLEPEPTVEAEASATESEAKPPLTKFSIADKEGELEIPELFLSFKADGKEYEKLPLDKVVSFAQMGIYNERKQRERIDVEQRATQAEQGMQEMQQQFERTNNAVKRLFDDPLYFERAKELYLAENSPESRAIRAEQELQQHRQNEASQREHQQVGQFVAQRLTPAVESLLKQNPLVSEAELIGQYTILTAPLLVRGRVPLERLSNVQTLVDHDLSSWAASLQLERSKTKKVETAKQAATKTQLAATKRQLARTVAPRGEAAPPAPAKPKKYESAEDWMQTLGGLAPAPAE